MDSQFFHFMISFKSFTIIVFHFNVLQITLKKMSIEAGILDKLFLKKCLVHTLEIHFQQLLVNFSLKNY